MTADGPSLREGNRNLKPASASAEPEEETALHSFEWRGGVERMTTGIWVWSEPFVRRTEGGKEVAVLLVDTQGMFDNETSMGLTACIFAVSTLVSFFFFFCQGFRQGGRGGLDASRPFVSLSRPAWLVGDSVVFGSGGDDCGWFRCAGCQDVRMLTASGASDTAVLGPWLVCGGITMSHGSSMLVREKNRGQPVG